MTPEERQIIAKLKIEEFHPDDSPIGTAQERELIERFQKREHYFRNASEGEYDANLLQKARFALQSRIAEVERFCAIMDKTDDEGFSPEIEQELMDLRAALSQHRKL